MFIPFYFPTENPLRLVIAGGGYAGLAALVTLREHRRDAEIVLVDPRPAHLKITHLHEVLRSDPDNPCLSFKTLETRFGIRHIQGAAPLDMASLERCNLAQCIAVAGESIEFDYLLVTAGLASSALEQSNRVLTLDDFSKEPSAGLLRSRLENSGGIANRHITVVGAGATGIQFLFELADWIRREHLPWRLRLVDSEATPLTQFNSKLGRYVAAKIIETEVEYVPRYFFRGQGDSTVRLENRDSGELSERPSDLTLLFAGKCPESRIETNWFGQVVSEGAVFERVFAAGDRACYPVPGSNALSAQSAVRKGKLAARNILRHSGSLKLLEPYLHQDLGYVISLGADDAIGWVGLERNVIGGRPATMIKELVESQYELLLAGVDTYLI